MMEPTRRMFEMASQGETRRDGAIQSVALWTGVLFITVLLAWLLSLSIVVVLGLFEALGVSDDLFRFRSAPWVAALLAFVAGLVGATVAWKKRFSMWWAWSLGFLILSVPLGLLSEVFVMSFFFFGILGAGIVEVTGIIFLGGFSIFLVGVCLVGLGVWKVPHEARGFVCASVAAVMFVAGILGPVWGGRASTTSGGALLVLLYGVGPLIVHGEWQSGTTARSYRFGTALIVFTTVLIPVGAGLILSELGVPLP